MSNFGNTPTQVEEPSLDEIARKLDNDHLHNQQNKASHLHDDRVNDVDHDHGDGHGVDMFQDIITWRRKRESGLVLIVATILWTLLQVYQFNFVPIASWIAMGVATSLFCYGVYLRLLCNEMPNVAGWQMTEQKAEEIAKSSKSVIEKGAKWMISVSCEREWYIFAAVLSSLILLAYVGRSVDLITILYAGTLLGMTIPAIHAKNQDKIKANVEKARVQGMRVYRNADEKVFSKLDFKHKNKKPKKAE